MDDAGRVVVERDFNEFGTFKETFYNWTSDPVETAHYDVDGTPINLMVLNTIDGRAESSLAVARRGGTKEEYLWDRNLVQEVRVDHAERRNGQLLRLEPLHTAKIHYDDRRRVQRVELHWPAKLPTRAHEIVELMFERRGSSIYRKRT